MAAGTGFIAGKRTGLPGSAAHDHKDIHPLTALGAFYLRKSGGVLAFVASFNDHTHVPFFEKLTK